LNLFRFKLLFAFCVSVTVLFAENPPRDALRLIVNFKDSAGAFDYFKSDDIPENAAQSVNNVDMTINGGLRRRKRYIDDGRIQFAGLTNTGKNASFTTFLSTTGRSYYFAHVDNVLRFEYILDRTQNPGQVNNTFLGPISFIESDGSLYIASESTFIARFNERNGNAIDGPHYVLNSPKGSIIKSHIGHYLIARPTTTELNNTVYFSSYNMITTWPAVNFFEIFAKSGEYITCMGDAIFGNVPLYTNQTVRLITGSQYPDEETEGNVNIRLIYDGLGCASQPSVKSIRNKQYFYSFGQSDEVPGIYEFNGVSVKEKTKPIRNFFLNEVSNSTATLPAAYIDRDRYCLSVATKTAIRLSVSVCVDETDRIWINRPSSVLMQATYKDEPFFLSYSPTISTMPTTAAEKPYSVSHFGGDEEAGDFVIGTVEQPINWSYQTKDFSMSSENNENSSLPKKPERIYLKTDSSTNSRTLEVTANYDFGKSSTVWYVDVSQYYTNGDIITISSSTEHMLNRLKFPTGRENIEFNYINFKVASSSPIDVDRLELYARPLTRR